MTRSLLLLPVLLAAGLAAPGCVSAVDEAARACPCAEGWTCCADGTCRPGGPAACPPAPAPDLGAPEAPRLDGTVPPTPSARTDVRVVGQSEPHARVRLFALEACVGTPLLEVEADGTGAFGVPVALAPDTRSTYVAQAVDAAGNLSPCSAPLVATHDGRAPEAPELLAVAPMSPAAEPRPLVVGRAEPGARVVPYADPGCALALGEEAVADAAGAVQVRAQPAPNTRTTLHARAFDAAGNGSACSASGVEYVHDDVAPLLTLTHAPPAAGTGLTQRWAGVAEPGIEVRVHTTPGCDDTPLHRAPAGPDGTWSVWLAASRDAAMHRWAAAQDAAGNRSACLDLGTYVHDGIPPPPPVILSVTPASPSRVSDTPRVSLRAEPGATVWLDGVLPGSGGAGRPPLAHGVASPTGELTLELRVPEGEASFWARARDAVGNVSGASEVRSFTYDVTPPPRPRLTALSEPSPSASATHLWALGDGEPGTQAALYADAACAGPALALGPVTNLPGRFTSQLVPGFALWASVPQGVDSTFAVRTMDAAGNTSACSAGLPFRHRPRDVHTWSAHLDTPLFEERRLTLDAAGTVHGVAVESVPGGAAGRLVLWRVMGERVERLEVLTEQVAPYTSGTLVGNLRGDLLAAWAEAGSGVPRVARRLAATGAWEQPAPPEGGLPGWFDVSLDAQGHALACGVRERATPEGGTTPWRACSRAAPGGAWGPVEDVVAGRGDDTPVRATSDGAATALRLTRDPATSALQGLYARTYRPGVGWGEEQLLDATPSSYPRLEVDHGGGAWALWRTGGRGLAVARLQAGAAAWSAPEQLVDVAGETWSLDVGAAGDATVGWSSLGSPVQVRLHAEGAGWSEVATLALPTGGDTPSVVRVAHGAPGEAWVLWETETGPGFPSLGTYTESEGLWAQRLVRDAGWEAPLLLSWMPPPLQLVNVWADSGIVNDGAGGLAVSFRRYGTPGGLRVLR